MVDQLGIIDMELRYTTNWLYKLQLQKYSFPNWYIIVFLTSCPWCFNELGRIWMEVDSCSLLGSFFWSGFSFQSRSGKKSMWPISSFCSCFTGNGCSSTDSMWCRHYTYLPSRKQQEEVHRNHHYSWSLDKWNISCGALLPWNPFQPKW